jgi:hypothetical protein
MILKHYSRIVDQNFNHCCHPCCPKTIRFGQFVFLSQIYVHVLSLCYLILSESVYYVLTAAVYRNLYCYLCNVGTNTIPETCNRTSYFRDPFESSFSLTNLLQSPLQHSNEDNECKADEIYDTFLVSHIIIVFSRWLICYIMFMQFAAFSYVLLNTAFICIVKC